MARPKKEEKASASTAELPNHISVEDFTRTRDAIVTGLTEIQRVVGDLLRGYIYHTNKVLGGETMTMGLDTLPNNPFPTGAATRAPSEPPAETTKSGKKKRPKKEVDPNAPKKPLTLFFYFAQNARQVVRNDLGIAEDDTEQKGRVEQEVLNRYHGLSEEEKTMWRDAYQKDLEQWKIEMAAYQKKKAEEAGAAAPEAIPEIEMAEDDVEGGAVESEAEVSSEEEEEEEVPVPPKAPTPPVEKPSKTPKSNKRRKTGKENGLPVPAVAPAAASSPIPIPSSAAKPSNVPLPGEVAEPAKKANNKRESKERSPEEPKKKKARKAKEPKEVKATTEAEPAKETPAAAPEKEKRTKKRGRKSDAA